MLTKLKILAYKDEHLRSKFGEYEVQINPEKYSQAFGVTFSQDKGIDAAAVLPKFKTQTPQQIRLEFLLDSTGVVPGVKSVPDNLKKFREVAYDFNETDELVLSYATTVHKSQGSEYPAVVVPIHTQHYTLLQRNLLYTAITRGRRLLVLVGSTKAVAMAVKRVDSQRRVTMLKQRLIALKPHGSSSSGSAST